MDQVACYAELSPCFVGMVCFKGTLLLMFCKAMRGGSGVYSLGPRLAFPMSGKGELIAPPDAWKS